MRAPRTLGAYKKRCVKVCVVYNMPVLKHGYARHSQQQQIGFEQTRQHRCLQCHLTVSRSSIPVINNERSRNRGAMGKEQPIGKRDITNGGTPTLPRRRLLHMAYATCCAGVWSYFFMLCVDTTA